MSLEQLYKSEQILSNSTDAAYNAENNPVFFFPSWDAAMIMLPVVQQYGNMINYFGKLFRDGSFVPITPANRFNYMPKQGPDVVVWQLPLVFGDSFLYQADPFLLLPIFSAPLNGVPLTYNPTHDAGIIDFGDYIDTTKGWIFHATQASKGSIAAIFSLADASHIKDITFGIPLIANHTWKYFPAGIGRIGGYINTGSGTDYIFVYDYVSDVLVGCYPLPSVVYALYDSNFDLFWVIGGDKHLYIYSGTELGENLAAPTLTPAGNVYRYAGYIVTTRLTGHTGNPIPNRILHWSLTNSLGWLDKVKTRTDEKGYSTNYWWTSTDFGLSTPLAPVVSRHSGDGMTLDIVKEAKISWFNDEYGIESSLSPASNAVTLFAGGAQMQIVPHAGDTPPVNATHWRVYLRPTNTNNWLFVAQVPVSQTSYIITTPDNQLGAPCTPTITAETITVTLGL